MQKKITGLIIFSKNIKDNDLYIKILSSNDEINSGIVYGGNSSKKKLIFQDGYFINYSISKKNENAPPFFSGELSKPFIGNIYDNKYKLNALLSILSLINLSFLEGQSIKGYYLTIYDLFCKIINQKHWIVNYCEWLFELLKLIGYEIEYKENFQNKFFNIEKKRFSKDKYINSIEFPHEIFTDNRNINYKNLFLIFNIFESIFLKNHLDNINNKMPINYINFKNIVLKKIKQ